MSVVDGEQYNNCPAHAQQGVSNRVDVCPWTKILKTLIIS